MFVYTKKAKELGIKLTKGTPYSVGIDLQACIDETMIIHRGSVFKVPTGIKIDPKWQQHYLSHFSDGDKIIGMEIRSRSSLAAKGILVTNAPGTIDPDFEGEICVLLSNISSSPISINQCDRIAQLVLNSYLALYEEIEVIKNKRGEGGFGSTGK